MIIYKESVVYSLTYLIAGINFVNKFLPIKLDELLSISHHGIKGQKWGERNGPPYPIKRKKSSEYEIEDKSTGEIFHLSENTRINNKQIFAGKGSKHPLDPETAFGLSEQIGGNPSEWKHCKGDGTIDYHGEDRNAEIHWFEEASLGKYKFKIKRWLDD